jgi:hypothetical protein
MELQAEIENAEQALEKKLRRRPEHAGITASCSAPRERRRKLPGVKLPWTLLLLGIIGCGNSPA